MKDRITALILLRLVGPSHESSRCGRVRALPYTQTMSQPSSIVLALVGCAVVFVALAVLCGFSDPH